VKKLHEPWCDGGHDTATSECVGTVTPRYHHEVILAMELNRSHIGKLVQMITDSWSMTGTLTRVDQHDNREWEIAYPSRQLVPVRGEIYATLTIGPWRGDVIGNQPVTVETVAGTLEAPETATKALPHLITEEETAEARRVIEGTVVGPDAPRLLHFPSVHGGARCGAGGEDVFYAAAWDRVTCPGCRSFKGWDDLPPKPPAEWKWR
jgi:hypothetical protein